MSPAQLASVGAKGSGAGPPQAGTAPSGGSAAHEVASVGATYIGRFAPSPTGPLHAGSLVAALASWLDARAHDGQWLVRIEDVDAPRCNGEDGRLILQQLAQCGLQPDAATLWQSGRRDIYQRALEELIASALAYPCTCSRKAIEARLSRLGQARLRHGEMIYPGTCRNAVSAPSGPSRRAFGSRSAWRFRSDFHMQNQAAASASPAQEAIKSIAVSDTQQTPAWIVHWHDRRLGPQQQDVPAEVGDFVLQRADACFAYQLAVVVDDAAQGITDVVRGEDLADNTARQILLQRALALPTPRYLHTPLVLGPNGEKLSKQNGAKALDLHDPLRTLNQAAHVLGLPEQAGPVSDALAAWVADWQRRRP